MTMPATKSESTLALGDSNERFNDVIALSSDWYWELNENFCFTAVSGAVSEKIDVAPAMVLGKAIWDCDAMPAGKDASWEKHRATLSARLPFRDFIYSNIDGNGEIRYVQASGKPAFDAQGVFRGYRGIARDATESMRAEELRRLEHAVTRCIAEAESFSAAIETVIRTICESEGWECGDYWSLDEPAGVRRLLHSWGVDSDAIRRFQEQSRGMVLPAAEGNVGKVFASGKPFWNADMALSGVTARAQLARDAQLHALFIWPIIAGGKTLAAISFNSQRIRKPDDRFLQAFGVIGSQVGQFLQRKQAEERIRHLAHHDGLTGLPNRAMFGELLTQAVQHGRRYKRQVAVMFIDLDRFKIINDTLGHEAGDQLLKEMSSRLRHALRASDVVARLGGDEFVVLAQEVEEPRQMEAVARKLLASIIKPMTLLGQECRVSASIGICMCPADAQDEESLMKNADIAMYQAKEEGKNDFRFYSENIKVNSFEHLAMETSLRHALERNELLLHYQAKLDLTTGRITGMEALMRWQHPDLGLVAPAKFIPLAEETGLIIPIGRWVLKTACEQSVAWQHQGLPALCMAVNLSARQFADENLLDDLKQALDASGLNPQLLELELTESMVMHDIDRATQTLAAIKKIGVRLAIDDFGIGYSSLATLKRFPFDTLKIDRSFIRDIAKDGGDKAIAEAIIAMGKTLSLTVIAEGVETDEQRAFVQHSSCDQMQGFHFSKPLTQDAFGEFLRQHILKGHTEAAQAS